MNFKEWLINEKTLYHGTVIDNLNNIKALDLRGSAGDFVKHSYDEYPEEDLPELVFAADKHKVSNALTAMVHHIGKKLNKDLHSVNDNDILNHGLLVIIRDGDTHAQHRPEDDENYYGQHPGTVEPGDYYSEELPAHGFIQGRALLRFLRQMSAWPRTWGKATPQSERTQRGELIRMLIAQYPEKSKEEIIKKVQSISISQAQNALHKVKLGYPPFKN